MTDPRIGDSDPDDDNPVTPTAQSASSATTILIVDDSKDDSELLRLSLRRLGHHSVQIVDNGPAAIALIERSRPRLIFMDVRLNGGSIDGIQTAKAIQARWQVPIIYLTGAQDADVLRRADETKHYGFLVKGCRDQELRSVINLGLFRVSEENDAQEARPRQATRRDWQELAPEQATVADLYVGLVTVERFVANAIGAHERLSDQIEALDSKVTKNALAAQAAWEAALEAVGTLSLKLEEMALTCKRTEAMATVMCTEQMAREDSVAKEGRDITQMVKDIRETKRRVAEIMSRVESVSKSADDSQQRIEMKSQHEIDRILKEADKLENKIVAETRQSLVEIKAEATRGLDKLEEATDDKAAAKVAAKVAKHVEISKAKWTIIAIVIGTLATTASTIGIYYATRQATPSHVESHP